MKKRHNIVVVCVITAILINMLVIGAYAASGSNGSMNWSMDNSTLTISGSGNTADLIKASSTVRLYNRSAKSLAIGNGIDKIGEKSFCGFNELENVSLPSSVKTIERRAFYQCVNLENVTFSNGLESIGKEAFQSTKLKNVVLPDGLKEIGEYAFKSNYDLKSIFIPSSVTTIGKGAFASCSGLTIKGYAGSYAQEYAYANNIKFMIMNESGILISSVAVKNGDKFDINISITGTPAQSDIIIAALYNADGMLLDFSKVTYEEYLTGTKPSVNVDASANVLKVFIWNNFSNIKPVSDAETVAMP